ncbi:hypothetical protein K437DRAFT_122008 [Tilletiaria anomala UBC 951]|uniref:Ada DNA repair metal-binding domain-containing protein n=1 Tax=Tilletiaria anomala (strain ATCC 24038 / CBS 436.72 / UBC 951) TaxID=1037660 RepID=A0A066W3X1_TILAU|nr:uncharacterized protein K437DRAFT_122008 [Tilletiaria anomala UBC 951]KDN45465.1 hypothetical protein K437DRAFT_122008 [Tilletiaria anomala UBC 951]
MEAVPARARAADTHFVCAHLTTRIYCQQLRVAKKPGRLCTTYFSFPGGIEEAETAGIRRCKRCKPEIHGTAENSAFPVGQCIRHIVDEGNGAFLGRGNTQVADDVKFKPKTLKQ